MCELFAAGEIFLRRNPDKQRAPRSLAALINRLSQRLADFLNCFRCPEQVIVGDDLHKVFSFYWLLLKERNSLGKHRWGKRYAWVIRVIERDIEPQFPAEMVHDEKHKARTSPHAMWRDRHILGDQE